MKPDSRESRRKSSESPPGVQREGQRDRIDVTDNRTLVGTGAKKDNGTNGINGTNGTNGTNAANGTNSSNGINDTNGTNGTNATNGTNYRNGTNGTNGANGTNVPNRRLSRVKSEETDTQRQEHTARVNGTDNGTLTDTGAQQDKPNGTSRRSSTVNSEASSGVQRQERRDSITVTDNRTSTSTDNQKTNDTSRRSSTVSSETASIQRQEHRDSINVSDNGTLTGRDNQKFNGTNAGPNTPKSTEAAATNTQEPRDRIDEPDNSTLTGTDAHRDTPSGATGGPDKPKSNGWNNKVGPKINGPPTGGKKGKQTKGSNFMLLSSVQTNLSKQSLEDVASEVFVRVARLLPLNDFTLSDLCEDFSYIRIVSRFGMTVEAKLIFSERMSKLNVCELFQKVWRIHFFTDDFRRPEMNSLYSNMTDSLYTLCNVSDKSEPLCTHMYKLGLHTDLLKYISHQYFKPSEGELEPRLRRLLLFLMNLLYDLVQNVLESWGPLRAAGAVEALQIYRESKDEQISCKALVLQAYVITEEENEKLNSDDETFKFLLKVLETTLQTKDHYSTRHQFSTIELVCSLNRLSSNDQNKVRIVGTGGLPLYVKLLQDDCNVEEQKAACEGLWNLAFKCKDQILAEPGCLKGLQRLLSDSPDQAVRQQARGAIWILHSGNQKGPARIPSVIEIQAAAAATKYSLSSTASNVAQLPTANAKKTQARSISPAENTEITSQPQSESPPHIFISYQWGSKSSVLRLRDRLKKAGYIVWVDVDNMSGSVLEAMAEAVERAVIVIVCLTEKYKQSPNCRTEAEYTFRLQKDVIPVRMQDGYTPDGWLGILIGSKLVHDFVAAPFSPNNSQRGSQKALVEAEEAFYQGLFRDLGNKGKGGKGTGSPPRTRNPSVVSSPGGLVGIKEEENEAGDKTDGESKREKIQHWCHQDVSKWLNENHLKHLHNWFTGLDGPLLLEYQLMRQEAPESFYKMLNNNNFSLQDSLRLSSCLNHLT